MNTKNLIFKDELRILNQAGEVIGLVTIETKHPIYKYDWSHIKKAFECVGVDSDGEIVITGPIRKPL